MNTSTPQASAPRRARPQKRRPALSLTLAPAVLLVACASASAPVGVSTAAAPAAIEPRPAPPAPLAATALPSDYRTRFVKLNASLVLSRGHAAGRFLVDLYANELGRSAYGATDAPVPVGAVLVKEHFETRGESRGRGPVMLMEKKPAGFDPQHGDWRYMVVNSAGELVKDGPLESCAGCHDDAPHDHLFVVP